MNERYMSVKSTIGEKLRRAPSWAELFEVAETWRQKRSHDIDGLLVELARGWQSKNRAQVARVAVKLRSIHEKLTPALGSVVREFCWVEEGKDTPAEQARWTAARQAADANVATWLRDFMAAIRHLELELMFDELNSVDQAVAGLPPAKKALFDNIKKMMEELKREDD